MKAQNDASTGRRTVRESGLHTWQQLKDSIRLQLDHYKKASVGGEADCGDDTYRIHVAARHGKWAKILLLDCEYSPQDRRLLITRKAQSTIAPINSKILAEIEYTLEADGVRLPDGRVLGVQEATRMILEAIGCSCGIPETRLT